MKLAELKDIFNCNYSVLWKRRCRKFNLLLKIDGLVVPKCRPFKSLFSPLVMDADVSYRIKMKGLK